MVQLTLNLKSKRPSRVFALNGKSYKLQPGSNTLNLEYDDYVSLTKALHITPVDCQTNTNETRSNSENSCLDTELTTDNDTDSIVKNQEISHTETESKEISHVETESKESLADESINSNTYVANDSFVEQTAAIDYSTWSMTKLKSEYKKVTGTTCKLKKDEVILFLQENCKNV